VVECNILNHITKQEDEMNQEKKKGRPDWRAKKDILLPDDPEEEVDGLDWKYLNTNSSKKKREKRKQKPSAKTNGKIRH